MSVATLRLDKALWYLRLAKTRALAGNASPKAMFGSTAAGSSAARKPWPRATC